MVSIKYNKMGTNFLFFLMLGLIYFALFIQGIFRLRNTNSLVPGLRSSFIFYLSILLQISIQVLSNVAICIIQDKISLEGALLLLFIPSTLYTISYLLLVWQMLSVYTQAHLRSGGPQTVMNFLDRITESPKSSKVTGYFVFFLTI